MVIPDSINSVRVRPHMPFRWVLTSSWQFRVEKTWRNWWYCFDTLSREAPILGARFTMRLCHIVPGVYTPGTQRIIGLSGGGRTRNRWVEVRRRKESESNGGW